MSDIGSGPFTVFDAKISTYVVYSCSEISTTPLKRVDIKIDLQKSLAIYGFKY